MLADLQAVKRMLRASPDTDFGPDDDARLEAINEAASLAFEQRVGRSFAGNAGPTTRHFTAGTDGEVLFTRPVRSVSAVAAGGLWDGAAYAGATALTMGRYRLDRVDRLGKAYRMVGPWLAGTVVAVTGVWDDTDDTATVPADVVYAVNYLVAELWKIENASPAGFTGPDGATVPIRDPWKSEIVKQALAYHGVGAEIVL